MQKTDFGSKEVVRPFGAREPSSACFAHIGASISWRRQAKRALPYEAQRRVCAARPELRHLQSLTTSPPWPWILTGMLYGMSLLLGMRFAIGKRLRWFIDKAIICGIKKF